MIESGIKPVYVFDGKPPSLKSVVVRFVLDLLLHANAHCS
jgi:hypothetical protein